MDMPAVHKCAQLIEENDQLKKKLKKVRQQNQALQRELNDIKDRQRMEAMLKEFVTTRNMEVQTDPPKSLNICTQPRHKKLESEPEKVSKLLTMHNSLMRRYEKELKTNMQHVETITTLNLKVNELEQKLRESELKHLEQTRTSRSRPKGRSQLSSDPASTSSSEDTSEITKLKQQVRQLTSERNKLRAERQRMKDELKGLDEGFFEEIEDLKFGLQQSAKLNRSYEVSLRRLCQKFGVPYPHPEKQLQDV